MKSIMEELGFIITPEGYEFKFGKYKPFFLRDKENPEDYHNTSFYQDVMNDEKWQSLGYPVTNQMDITYNIATFTSWGLIVGLNKTEGSYTPSTSTIILTIPNNLTEEQINVLLNKKDQLIKFDKDLSYVRIIDNLGNTIERFQYIKDFYEKYIYPNVSENLRRD